MVDLSLSINLTFLTLLMQSQVGHIQLILGPMFAGKTSEMIRRVLRYQHARKKCMVVSCTGEEVTTHDEVSMKVVKTDSLEEVYHKARSYQVVAIDEGHCFQDVAMVAEKLANLGVIVIVASLDGNPQRQHYGHISELIPLSEKIDKLTAICIKCFEEAAFTRKFTKVAEEKEESPLMAYEPVCRKCFFNKSPQQAGTQVSVTM